MALFEKSTTEITVDDLVGEGKKFQTPDDLARGKAEADRVIEDRNRELAELRAELDKRDTVEDIIRRTQTPLPQSHIPATESKPAAEAPVFTDEDLDKRVKSVLQQTSIEQARTSNTDAVSRKLIEVYGTDDKANQAVIAKAAELGIPLASLEDVAATSPKAFFSMFGLNDTAPQATPSTRGDVNTEGFANTRPGQPQPGTYDYWETLRKEKGDRWYFGPDVQNQIMKDAFAAEKQGKAFFRN